MKIFLLVSIFVVFCAKAESKETDFKIFKHKRCGYQFDYSNDWYPVTEDEPDDDTGLVGSIHEAGFVTMYQAEGKRKFCELKEDCKLSVISYLLR